MSPTFWAKNMGNKAYKSRVCQALASFKEEATLEYGRIVDRPYRSNLAVEDYTKGTAATAQDLTATSDQLTINKQKVILMYVDDVDKMQNKWDAARIWGEEAGIRIAVSQDAEFLYEVYNAADTIDDGDIGGTAGNALTLTVSNISKVIGAINKKLDINNVDLERKKRFWALSPQAYEVLWQYIAGKETLLGDKTGEFGNIGRYGGLELFMTNNLTASAVWTPVDNPTTGATITIDGVVFTFEDTLSTTEGSIHITSTTAKTLDSLVAAINTPGTSVVEATDTGFTAFTGSDLRTVQEMVAVDGTTYITVYHKGQSFMTVATSEALDLWSARIQHNLAGVKGAIDMVVQKQPDLGPGSMASTVSAGKRGMNIMPLSVFGIKTFNQGTSEIFDVQLVSTNF